MSAVEPLPRGGRAAQLQPVRTTVFDIALLQAFRWLGAGIGVTGGTLFCCKNLGGTHLAFQKDWVVYAKRPFGGPEYVLRYLGRHTHRVAISNHRLVSFADGKGAFRWRDCAHNNEQKLLTLAVDEFLRRFLLHLFPEAFVRIDYHPSFQVIAFLIEETGEYEERELNHSDGEAERFYRDLHHRGMRVRVGMEATGFSRWFERLIPELNFELWIGDPDEIKAKRVKKQKYDREEARLLLRLLRENNFPKIWVPSPENRDLRQLLWHRHRLVQMRTRNHESTSGVGHERRQALEEKAVEHPGTRRVGEAVVSSVGQPPPQRVVRAAGPTRLEHRGVNRNRRTRS